MIFFRTVVPIVVKDSLITNDRNRYLLIIKLLTEHVFEPHASHMRG